MALDKCPKVLESVFAFVVLPTDGYTTVVKLLEVHAPVGSDEHESDSSLLDNKEKHLT